MDYHLPDVDSCEHLPNYHQHNFFHVVIEQSLIDISISKLEFGAWRQHKSGGHSKYIWTVMQGGASLMLSLSNGTTVYYACCSVQMALN